MRKILAIFKTPTIRTALFCAVFCAVALCSAQETARGIVAEKVDTEQNGVERPEPELRFAKETCCKSFCAVSSDLRFIVFKEDWDDYGRELNKYRIVDFATGYVLRTINLYRDNYESSIVGISNDNSYMKISYDNEAYIYSIETGQQVSEENQHFTYFKEIDKENEIPPFADNKELYEVFKSKTFCLTDDKKHLYILYSYFEESCVVFDSNTKKIYDFSLHNIKEAYQYQYIYQYKGSNSLSIVAAYSNGHIIHYSTKGEVLSTYDFYAEDIIYNLEQQENYLIAYGQKKLYVYDLYLKKLLKYFSAPYDHYYAHCYFCYFNYHDEYLIYTDSGNCVIQYDFKSGETKSTGDIDENSSFSLLDDTTFIHINNSVYFLVQDENYKIIITTYDVVENKINHIQTGIPPLEYGINFCNLVYNEKNNMLYMSIYDYDYKLYYILKCDLITKQCSAYHPENEYNSVYFIYADDFDTAFLSNYDCSRCDMVNLKDFTLIEHSDLLEEKIKKYCSLDFEDGYICTLTTRNTVCKYNNKGEFVTEYMSREEYRKSKDYQPFHFMTKTGVTKSDFYGELYHVQFVQNGESLIYTPEGFFCGSEWATQNLVYIVDGMDVIGIDQVYDTYYRPDLVAAKMRGEDISEYASSVRLASLVRSGRAPMVSLSGIPAESSGRDMTFDISVRNTGGGIGAVNLLLNGKVIRLSDGVASADGETISFRHTVTLQNGSNMLEAFALNGAGLVESVRSSAQVVWRGATEKPDLYVLTAAVNRYRDKSLCLNYAVPDAQSVAEGFQKQKSGLYRNVHISQLNDSDVTKEKLATEFLRLSQHIRADDVFVFFISGHGMKYDGDGDYYYLPYDFRYTSEDSIPIGGISKNDLQKNLSKIKAGKTLVMLDTCGSGAFISDSNQRGISEKTAIDRLTRATGHATLAASADSQYAMEGYNGHGVFTYVFLEGIAGAADSDGDGYVTLNELSTFIEREVPERSYEKWGYEQIPQRNLRNQDFPIAGK